VAADGLSLTLVNTNLVDEGDVVLQAGSFAEHEFTEARSVGEVGAPALRVEGPHLRLRLGPGARAEVEVGLRRLCRRPTRELPPMA